MKSEAATKFMDELIANPELRSQFRSDPEGALAQSGVELDEEERKALTSQDWSGFPDQELGQRVSKITRWG